MAKRIYSTTPSAGLTAQATLGFDQYFEVDYDGWTETKNLKADILLRTRVKNEVDESGNSSGTLDFTNYNEIYVVIDQDYTGTLSGIAANEVVYLHVFKGATDTFTPSIPATGTVTISSYQQTLTHLIYRITSNTTSGGYTSKIIEPLITNVSGTLASAKFTGTGFTITSFNYFRYYIDHNMLNFETEMTVEITAVSTTGVSLTIADWNIVKKQADEYAPANSVCISNTTTDITKSCSAKETSLVFRFSAAAVTSDSIVLQASGSFQII